MLTTIDSQYSPAQTQKHNHSLMTSTITSKTGQNQNVTINEVCEAGKFGKHFSGIHSVSIQNQENVN